MKLRYIKKILGKNSNKKERSLDCFNKTIIKYISPKIENLTFVDIGANRGLFYENLKSVYKKSKITAMLIEPIPECIKELRDCYGNDPNVKIFQVALSDTIERRNFHINSYDVTSSLLKIKYDINDLKGIDTNESYSLELTTTTLDKLVRDCDIKNQRINLMKIDVQGSENEVLLGANDTLSHTEYIWIEVSFKELYEDSCLFQDVYSILQASNFILVEICDGFRSIQNELIQADCLFRNINIH
ncbi:MAG: FkbM family methyltransferase [Bacteroidales bacterium]|nr:FkbM family methyltransferase [Bacteroidales bacterium]